MPAYARATFDQVMVPNYAPGAFVPVSGKGSRVKDRSGRVLIDFAGGIAVTALGHCHPRIVKALRRQADRLWHVSNVVTNEPALELASKLVAKTFAERVFLCNSGAEANEAALKLARRVASDNEIVKGKRPDLARRHEILAFQNAFHGRTLLTVTATGQKKYLEGYGPLPAGIRHVPYNDLAAARAAITDRTCAVIVEPMQGEGGVTPATKAFLKGLRKRCNEAGALLVFDEIQSGAGRTGALYAYMKYGVTPDILTTAKGLGAGFPIGAMLTTAKLAAHFTVGSHGTTFGGNPLACAAALSVLDTLVADDLCANAARMGERLVQGLRARLAGTPGVVEVRGRGLMVGIELREPCGHLVQAALEQGLLINVTADNVIRLLPPLVIQAAEVDQIIDTLAALIAAQAGGAQSAA